MNPRDPPPLQTTPPMATNPLVLVLSSPLAQLKPDTATMLIIYHMNELITPQLCPILFAKILLKCLYHNKVNHLLDILIFSLEKVIIRRYHKEVVRNCLHRLFST